MANSLNWIRPELKRKVRSATWPFGIVLCWNAPQFPVFFCVCVFKKKKKWMKHQWTGVLSNAAWCLGFLREGVWNPSERASLIQLRWTRARMYKETTGCVLWSTFCAAFTLILFFLVVLQLNVSFFRLYVWLIDWFFFFSCVLLLHNWYISSWPKITAGKSEAPLLPRKKKKLNKGLHDEEDEWRTQEWF